jgi:hypothetical protein
VFALLSPRLLIALAIAIALAASHFTAYRHGRAAVRAEWDRDKAERTTAALAAEQAARVKEGELRRKVSDVDKELQASKALRVAAEYRTAGSMRRLSEALAANPAPGSTSTASGVDGDPRDGIIAQCADAYRRLESAARSVESQVAGLQGYAKVCVSNP